MSDRWQCLECKWEGPAEDVDYAFLPPGQEMTHAECQQWQCPECKGSLERITNTIDLSHCLNGCPRCDQSTLNVEIRVPSFDDPTTASVSCPNCGELWSTDSISAYGSTLLHDVRREAAHD